jgi:hypothetical protein
MLEHFGIAQRMLAFNADNISSNDTQTRQLAKLDNSFESTNRARCFNHTLQLAVKTLLLPFNAGIHAEEKTTATNDDIPELVQIDDDEDDDDENIGECDESDADDCIDELVELDATERESLLDQTLVVRETITKVS